MKFITQTLKQLPLYKEEELNIKTEKLLKKMTLKEKIGQLYQAPYFSDFVTGHAFDASDTVQAIKRGDVGSVLSVHDEQTLNTLQQTAVNESRLGIPLMFCFDVIHGYRTAFPTNLALSSTWNPSLIEKISKAVAYETTHKGIHLTFSPMVDLVKDPRWGRVMESNGEDPYLSSELAKAYVKGYQQDSLSNNHAVAACVKHFIGYGAAEGGRDYNTVDISPRQLYNYYLPPFKAAIDAGVETLMTSFNVIFDRPATANKYLLKDVLRDHLNFKGVTISDYTASEEMIDHKVAKDLKDVAKQCIEAGLDHEMVSKSYVTHLESLVKNNEIDILAIDEATKRMLKLKFKLGLFDDPYRNFYDQSESYMLNETTRNLALKAAEESIVLLENSNNILPLKTLNKVAILGPFASSKDLIGAWGGLAKQDEVISLKEAFKNESILIDSSDTIEHLDLSQIDTVIVAIGESSMASGEGHSLANINVDQKHLNLLKQLKALNKKVITIIFAGRPLVLTELKKETDALLYAWQLGTETGSALKNIIMGITAPSGRLTMSFPQHVGQIPLYYNHLSTGRPQLKNQPNYRYRSHYLDIPNEPLYPFGYGLTYGDIIYSNLELDQLQLEGNDTLNASITLKNASNNKTLEVVQCYIEALTYSIARPVNELKKFKKVVLEPNEIKTINFKFSLNDFKAYNQTMAYTAEHHDYLIKIGKNALNTLESTINVKDVY